MLAYELLVGKAPFAAVREWEETGVEGWMGEGRQVLAYELLVGKAPFAAVRGLGRARARLGS